MEQRQHLQHRSGPLLPAAGPSGPGWAGPHLREVRDSAYEIIRRKGATYYGIAMAVARIAECIVRDERAMLPVSVLLQGQYGAGRSLSSASPPIVGRNGVESVLEIPLDPGERQALLDSAARLKAVILDAGL